MTIGSFVDHRNLLLKDVGGPNPESYYYLDDISLVPIEESKACACNFEKDVVEMEDDSVNNRLEELLNLEEGEKVILEDIYFENDKSALLPSSFSALNELLMVLEQRPNIRIELSGHTSSIGGYDHNMKLSRQRAESVRKFLILNGIPKDRIATTGYGPNQAIADNSTEEGQRLNRRVEFKVLNH